MVGILAEDHDLDGRERSQFKGLEYLAAGGIDGLPGRLLPMQETHQRGEVRLLELRCQCVFPGLFYLNVHLRENVPDDIIDGLHIHKGKTFPVNFLDIFDIFAVFL